MIAILTYITITGAACAALAGGWRFLRPKVQAVRHKGVAVTDAILGRPAHYDSITGQELLPAVPGIGVRLAFQEEQMSLLTASVSRIADSHERLENHESRIKHLEEAAVERVVTRAESAQAFRAMEAAFNANSHDTTGTETYR